MSNTACSKEKTKSLVQAAKEGDLEVVNILVEGGANMNRRGKTSPLIEATKGHHKDVVEYLLKKKANPNARRSYKTAIHCSVDLGNKDITELLLRYGAKVDILGYNETPLYTACYTGNKDIVELLLKHKATVNKGNMDESALCLATTREHKDIVHLLLQHKADVNQPPRDNIRPIYMSLLNEVNVKTKPNTTTLGNNNEITSLLLRAGANTLHKAYKLKKGPNISWNDLFNSRQQLFDKSFIQEVTSHLKNTADYRRNAFLSKFCRRSWLRVLLPTYIYDPLASKRFLSIKDEKQLPNHCQLRWFFSRNPGLLKWIGTKIALFCSVQ